MLGTSLLIKPEETGSNSSVKIILSY